MAQTEEPDYSEYIKTFGEEPPWAAASRSRRNNPYLKKEQVDHKTVVWAIGNL
jgi:hypothetical protein